MLGYDDFKEFKDDGETLLGEDPRGGRRARKLLSVTLLLGVGAVALLGVGVLSVLGVLTPLGGMLAPPLTPAPIASANPHGVEAVAAVKPKISLPWRPATAPPSLTALLVVGTKPDEPLFADLPFKQRLEAHGYAVTLIQDKVVTGEHCEAHDIMVVSGSVGGGNIGTRLNACTTPQIIYEVGLYQHNQMTGPDNGKNAWVTSDWWNTHHQNAWVESGEWPPPNTGAGIWITNASSPLAANYPAGSVWGATDFFTESYSMNWVNADSLGSGCDVVAILPREEVKALADNMMPKPDVDKVVLFKYEKGATLFSADGSPGEPSPALRIGFPPYCFIYGQETSCDEFEPDEFGQPKGLVPPCDACEPPACKTAEEYAAMGTRSSMPLSQAGFDMLDAAIAHCAASNLPALPSETRPSDKRALESLWEAMGKPGVMDDWGNADPCAGTPDTPNNAGFAFWKGVACRPCSDNPTLFCVRSIWLHQKSLKGQIPIEFRNLVDLEILLLSANNITGPLPTGMLATFPSLTKLDISYNNITGNFPLAELADLRRLKRVNADNNHLETISQPQDHGGFDSLLYFNIDYNRKLNGPFPAAFGAMPKLEYLSIHDTHFTGRLPTHARAFSSADTLLLSGSYVCGQLPPACFRPVAGQEEAAFCDVVEGGKSVLDKCNLSDGLIGGGSAMPKIRLGAAARQYSDAPFLVYMTVLTALGFEIEPVHNLAHADLYPLFTETPRTENTVDIVITSDLPNNHGRFLVGKHETFNVVGTSYNPLITGFASPTYSGINSIEALAKSTTVNKTILSYDVAACPVCTINGEEWQEARLPGFKVISVTYDEMQVAVASMVDANEEFAVVTFNTDGILAGQGLKMLDMEEFTHNLNNQGKVLVRKDAHWKLGPKGLAMLGAVYIPSNDVSAMDLKVGKGQQAQEVAAEWVATNKYIVNNWGWGSTTNL